MKRSCGSSRVVLQRAGRAGAHAAQAQRALVLVDAGSAEGRAAAGSAMASGRGGRLLDQVVQRHVERAALFLRDGEARGDVRAPAGRVCASACRPASSSPRRIGPAPAGGACRCSPGRSGWPAPPPSAPSGRRGTAAPPRRVTSTATCDAPKAMARQPQVDAGAGGVPQRHAGSRWPARRAALPSCAARPSSSTSAWPRSWLCSSSTGVLAAGLGIGGQQRLELQRPARWRADRRRSARRSGRRWCRRRSPRTGWD